jgi:ATP-dependent helicase/nuclease subunit B
MGTSARVYSVAPGRPLLATLAKALLDGSLPSAGGRIPGSLQLADTTLYLPTRRAMRPLQEAFLRISPNAALLLPRIKPIGQGSEEAELLASVEDYHSGGAANVPRVISELQRQLVLTQLVLRWAQSQRCTGPGEGGLLPYAAAGAHTPAQAAKLAADLARLIDMLETQDIDFAMLAELVPEEHSEHWSQTLAFLQIVTRFWPAHLAEHNLVSAVARRTRLLASEIERMRATPPTAPVIVAGVTAADPIACELIRAVCALPNGALVLPALDQTLDQESWAAIANHPEHPQFGLKKLIEALGLSRQDIAPLGGPEQAPARRARWSLACEAMRPAGTTERWHRFAASANKKDMAAALVNFSAIEAATADEEAEVAALILREVTETPGRTAMLVAPDRALARRVAARLAVWEIAIDDAGGEPFGRSIPGAFLDLVAATAEKNFAPVQLMSLLKHPLCRLGMGAAALRRGIDALEVAAFRAPYFGSGLDGVDAALEKARERDWKQAALRRLSNADWDAARALVLRLRQAFTPMAKAFASTRPTSLQVLARLHFETAQTLAKASERDDGAALRQGEAGEWAAQLFASLIDPTMPAPEMATADYPDFYRTLVARKTIRPRGATHPRLSICDPFEARLQQADVVILAGLNEGTWPAAADPGPWLNRPMRATLGLPAPEETIGAAAHDFTSHLGAARVVLTRAAKVDGAPTVPSRWLLRLEALVKGLGLSLDPETPWTAWAQARNTIPGAARPVRAPEPKPPVAARPRRLSVTAIETWIGNPYAIYARSVLGLEALPRLGERPGPSLRGQIVHDALGRFATRFPGKLPDDIAKELMVSAKEVLVDYISNPRVAAFWASRLARFAAWFAETEAARRAGIVHTEAEAEGKLVLEGPAGAFTLTARADRIDVGPDGLVIADYKTSQNLSELVSRAHEGQAPQLPLEGAIALAGGFANVPARRIARLMYISTAGGEPPGQEFPLRTDDAATMARDAQDGLARLIAAFDRPETPYRAVRRARFNYKYDAFAHLARVAEWSLEPGEEE